MLPRCLLRMKHVYQPGNSPAKKKPNTANSFDLLTDEMTDESYAAAASSSAESPAGGKPGTRSHSTNANGSDIPPTTPPPSGSATADSGSAPTPPAWFKAFELRQEERLDDILGLCREEHKGMCHAISILKDEVDKLSKKLEEADLKIDDLENRGRRNNIVLYRVPEGEEKKNCVNFVEDLLDQAGSTMGKNIQRAHRTGPPLAASKGSRPRPIHIGFTSFKEKEQARKALINYFKSKKDNDTEIYAVSDDYSVKVQKLRKAKIPELKKLRQEGKKAFLVYPAEIRISKN